MGISNSLKQFIKKGDFFNSYQMLRYQKETEYRTFAGGLISIAIIVIIVISFASMILDTINRTTITFSQSTSRNIDPTFSFVTASPDNNFMFGVQVWNYNLSSQNRLFDVFFTQIESNYGENYTYVNYPLQACTPQHWSLLSNVANNFQRLRVGNWLCPNIGTILKLQGKYSSQFYNQFSVTLYPCSNETDPLKPCASKNQIDQFFIDRGQWNYFTFYFVNSVINPDQPQYKSYYLQDRNFIVFGTEMGAQLDMYLNQIEIATDDSIWPFKNTVQDKVFNIDFNPILYPFAVNNATSYATFYVMKDPSQVKYKREVQKIFVVFSFMGGLIGAVMATLFIMNSYTSFAYELALALQVFKQNQDSQTHKELKKQQKSTVNLFHYLKYYVFICLNKVMDIEWTFAKYIEQCREEIQEQLDVKGLVKRLIFLEYAVSYILEDFHLQEMQTYRPVTPSQIKQLRLKLQASSNNNEKILEESSKQLKNNHVANEALKIQTSNCFQDNNVKLRTSKLKDNIISNQIQDEPSSRIAKRQNSIKNNSVHLQKLLTSAKQGNIISKKLLNLIHRQKQSQNSQISLQKIQFSHKH